MIRTQSRSFRSFGHYALIAGIAAAAAFAVPAHAEKFPNHSVQMVVGFPPGGGTDIVARIFADELAKHWKQPVVVENKAGAGGVIATEAIARSDPDGYTMFMGTMGNLSVNQHLYPMKIDPAKDLVPIGQAVAVHFVMVANPSLSVNSVKDLIALAKKKPGQINYSSSGVGGAPHLAGELFNDMAGVELKHIPYRGSGPSFNDLLGGQVQLTFDSLVQALPFIQAGRLKALAVLGKTRSPLLPDVPTMEVAGL
jgi:tripartite-type tricarboxylate transporter receptor subunit TctC